jgi:hypothetical protein
VLRTHLCQRHGFECGGKEEGGGVLDGGGGRGWGCVSGVLALMVTVTSYDELVLGFRERGLVDSGDRGGHRGGGENGCG